MFNNSKHLDSLLKVIVLGGNSNHCEKQTSLKYISRDSPPYPANKCRNEIKEGNDGNIYQSKSNKNGVYRWVLLKDSKKLKSIKKEELEETKSFENKTVFNNINNINLSDIEVYGTIDNGGEFFFVFIIEKLKYALIRVSDLYLNNKEDDEYDEEKSLHLSDARKHSFTRKYKMKIIEDFYNEIQRNGLQTDEIKPVKVPEKSWKEKQRDGPPKEFHNFKLRIKYEKVFIGRDTEYKHHFDGSNILFKLPDGKYIYITGAVKTFYTENNEEIKEYSGQMGSSGCPAPFAFTDNFIYILDLGEYVDLSEYKEWLKKEGITWKEGKTMEVFFEYYHEELSTGRNFKIKKDKKHLINNIDFNTIIDVFGY